MTQLIVFVDRILLSNRQSNAYLCKVNIYCLNTVACLINSIQFGFLGQDFGSDYYNSWPLLIFSHFIPTFIYENTYINGNTQTLIRLNMTEKLFTGTLNKNQNKTKKSKH